MKIPQYWWLVCAFGTGVAGWFLGRHTATSDTSISHPAGRSAIAATASSGGAPGRGAGKTEDSEPSPLGRFSNALHCPDPSERMKRFLSALEQMTPENAGQFNEVWANFLIEGKPDPSIAAFYNMRSGEVLGAKYLAVRTGSPADFKVIASIGEQMAGAMKSDSAGVRKWFDSLTNEPFRERLFGGYVSALATQDLPAAMEVMEKIDPRFQRQAAASIVSSLRQNRGSTELAGWLRETLNAPANAGASWRSMVFTEAVQQTSITRQGAFIGAGLIEEFAGMPFADSSPIGEVAEKYASFKPVEALEWAVRMEQKSPGADAGALLTTAISAVSDQSLRSVADWCRNRPPGEDRNAALTALIERAAPVDSALAAELEQLRGQ